MVIGNEPSDFLLLLLWNYPFIPWHTIILRHAQIIWRVQTVQILLFQMK